MSKAPKIASRVESREIALQSAVQIDPASSAKKALDDMAREIGRSAVNHLKQMYPDALANVTKTAEISLTNHIRNQINWRLKPTLKLLLDLHKQGKI